MGWGMARGIAAAGAFALAVGAAKADTQATSTEDLRNLSIEQLGQIEITSVEKSAQPLTDAPAAIYVITHDDIVRSGAVTLPEILRLAPNLFVAQTGAASYTITARGLAGNTADQSFANKLLVLIDGRSVYTPLFSGVYWDMQDLVPEDIERIEVISGPGATLWGANAFNGVINIITRQSADTQGALVDLTIGTLQSSATARFGGRLSDTLTYRAYVRELSVADTDTLAGAHAHDAWWKPQGGVRLDWTPSAADTVMLKADGFQGQGDAHEAIEGEDIVARWNHDRADGSGSQVLAYADHEARGQGTGGGTAFWIDNFDVEAQDGIRLGRQNLLVGGGVRVSPYHIVGTPTLFFVPDRRTLVLADVFAQDDLALGDRVDVILGLKAEDDPYSGVSLLPSLRASWKPVSDVLLWASVQRAIRSPTPFDRDVREKVGNEVFLTGDANFLPERLTAYEAGVRFGGQRASLSLSAYYHVYDQLRSIEPTPAVFIPIHWGNGLGGYAYGLDAWGNLQVLSWWRWSAGVDLLSKHLEFAPGASGLLGLAQAGDDPSVQAFVRSSMTLGDRLSLDADLRYVGALPNPRVPAYAELDLALGWSLTRHVQLLLVGSNLLHARHLEFAAPQATAIPRSAALELRVRF